MAENKKSPAEAKPDFSNIKESEYQIVNKVIISKDTAKLSKRQRKVAELLRSRKCSAADISVALHYSDPRSYIRELRDKGINVLDEWVSKDDVRYKRYWIEDKEAE